MTPNLVLDVILGGAVAFLVLGSLAYLAVDGALSWRARRQWARVLARPRQRRLRIASFRQDRRQRLAPARKALVKEAS